MQAAYELSERQSGRLLEQARRAGAQCELDFQFETRSAVQGVITSLNPGGIRLQLQTPPYDVPAGIVGACCDVRVRIDQQFFLFSTHVIELADDGRALVLANAGQLYVPNRRRFERKAIPIAAQVKVLAPGRDQAYVGLVSDISAHGLACTMTAVNDDDQLHVGDIVRLEFELPGCDQPFVLPAALCNKSLTKDKQLLTLGMEFSLTPHDAVVSAAYDRFRAALLEIINNSLPWDTQS